MRIVASTKIEVRGGSRELRVVHEDIIDFADSVDLLIVPGGGAVQSALSARVGGVPSYKLALPNRRLERRSGAQLEGLRYRSWDCGRLWGGGARIVVFAPTYFENASVAFRYLYESLVQHLTFREAPEVPAVRSVALPVLLAGHGGLDFRETCGLLMRGLVHWLAIGLPIERVDFVERHSDRAELAAELLHEQVDSFKGSPIRVRPSIRHDVFLSYAREDAADAAWVARTLRELLPDIELFQDVSSLRLGGVWQHQLYSAIDTSRFLMSLLSPHYLASEFCVEEYNIAVLRDRQDGSSVLFPVLLETVPLPGYMEIRQHVDCSPRNRMELSRMCRDFVAQLRAAKDREPSS